MTKICMTAQFWTEIYCMKNNKIKGDVNEKHEGEAKREG